MKWVATLALGVLTLTATSPLASAGDYHSGLTLRCADCHIMHYSQSHGYQPNGGGFVLTPIAGGPYHYLLRGEINDLCLACHDDASFAPDVLGANNGNGPTDVRLAGFLNRVGGIGLEPTGHTLDSTATAPGSNPAWSNPDGLNCIDCHHQHGRTVSGVGGMYRNLVADAGGGSWGSTPVSYNEGNWGTNDLTKDVFERAMASYDEATMDWNEPDETASAIATWCGGCHTNFHGAIGGPEVGGVAATTGFNEFIRHPSAGVQIGEVGGGHSRLSNYQDAVTNANAVKVMSASGVWTGTLNPDVTPTCISCHKAHGNGNAFGLIYRKAGVEGGTITENGSTNGNKLEHLCGQCHGQASAFKAAGQ